MVSFEAPPRTPARISRAAVAVAILAVVLAPCAPQEVLAQALHDPSAQPEHGVSAAIQPGDDFFAFANGDWLASTQIPKGKEKWSGRNEIEEISRQRVAKLLDDAASAPAGSAARKVADYRAAYLNQEAIDAKGIAPLAPVLDSIEHIADKRSLARTLGAELRADVDPLNWGIYNSSHVLGLCVEESIHGERGYVAFLVQGGLGLPDRESYIGADSAKAALRIAYQQYIARQLALAGFDRVDERAAQVMALEIALARSHATAEVVGERSQCRFGMDARGARESCAGNGLGCILRGGWAREDWLVRGVAAVRDRRRRGACVFAAARRLEGLSTIPRDRSLRRRAPARLW